MSNDSMTKESKDSKDGTLADYFAPVLAKSDH